MSDPLTIESTAADAAPVAPTPDPYAPHLAAVRAALAIDAPPDVQRAGLDVVRAIYGQICDRLPASVPASPAAVPAPAAMPSPLPASAPAPMPGPIPPIFPALPTSPLRGLTIDQALDAAIATLRAHVGDAGPAAPDLGPLALLLGARR